MRKLIFIGLLLLGGWCRGDSGDDSIPAIQVVHTWGDLLKTKPISVESERVFFPNSDVNGKGQSARVRVWVGIDRDHTTSYGGAVLYCLAQGVSFLSTQGADLGPFLVSVRPPKDEWVYLAPKGDLPLPPKDSSYLLFCRSIPFGSPGKYAIELFEPIKEDPSALLGGTNSKASSPSLLETARVPPKKMAQVEVTVSGEPEFFWPPWGWSKKEVMSHNEFQYISMTVTNPAGGLAIPETPKALILDGAFVPETPLPVLLPKAPDPGTRLKLVDNALIVTTSHTFAAFEPNIHFLTRWWINDKLWIPEADPKIGDPEEPSVLSFIGHLKYVKEARFDLDFRPERLGIKKGDKIGVQVLFCPGGWVSCREGFGFPGPDPADIFSLTQFSYPSNRIDFIYSGAPAHFQQK